MSSKSGAGFGRRSAHRDEPAVFAAGTTADDAIANVRQSRRSSGPAIPRWQLQIGLFLLVVVGFFAVVTFAMPAVMGNPSNDNRLIGWLARKNNVDVDVALPIQGIDEAKAARNRALVKACLAPKAQANGVAPGIKADWSTGQVSHHYHVAVGFLRCLMETDRARFCESAERRRMAEALTRYANLHSRYVRGRELARSVPLTSEWMMERMVGSTSRGDVASGEKESKLIDATLVDTVGRLSDDGFLSPKDFSGSVPDQLKPYVKTSVTGACG